MVHVEPEGFRPVFDDPNSPECSDLLPICPGYQVDASLTLGDLPTVTEANHEFGPVLEIWEGWATDSDLRFRASSGGILSALSLFCLESENFAGVVHSGMDASKPWMNSNYVSRDRLGILARTGSRYAPSAPCAGLSGINNDSGSYVFIGKPCDVSAVAELRRLDPRLDQRLGLVLTFFCAGAPSSLGTLNLIDSLGADRRCVDEVHYRGTGWPGRFRIVSNGKDYPKSFSYEESWGKLTSYRPLRCNLCPDGLGRLADIACGDAWNQFKDDEDPGRSLVLVRTERGRRMLDAARRAGYVTLKRVTANSVLEAQQNLLDRRRELFGRLSAFRAFAVPVPSYVGFSLLNGWTHQLRFRRKLQSFAGTVWRIAKRGWFKKRPIWSAQKAEAARV
jgi:coenzyme F420 hydrogenase subunit beta